MANGYNQYIGMRYVPLIDGEWSQSKAYEPLVVVTYNGNSYISKTYVPAGTLPTNETYWILAANYNAQVEQYRQEVRQYQQTVDTFDDDITTLQDDVGTLQTNVTNIDYAITNTMSLLAVLSGGFNVGSTASGERPAYTMTVNISANAFVRAFKTAYPNGRVRAFATGFTSNYGVVNSMSTSVTESGSIADDNYSCVVTVSGTITNVMQNTREVAGGIQFIVEGIR